MNELPDWLPDMICVDGDFTQVVSRLYNIFHRDFIETHPKLADMDVWHDRKVKDGKYEEVFWHLIERDHNKQGSRSFDLRRAERLPWCAPTLNNSKKPQVRYWICAKNKKLTCYAWLEDCDYVVVLEKRRLSAKIANGVEKPERTIAFLKTAYHVDGESQRRYFRKKYERRIT